MARNSLAYADDYLEAPEDLEEPRETLKVAAYTIQIGETLFDPSYFGPSPEGVCLTPPGSGPIGYKTVFASWPSKIALTDYPNDPNSERFTFYTVEPFSLSTTMEAAQTPAWREPTVLGLEKILQLPEGWDSYGASRVQENVANSALHLLESTAGDNAPAPIVVPTSDGGVQFEWHVRGLDIELAVPPHEAPELFFRDRSSGTEWDRELGADLGPLSKALKFLAERVVQERGR